MITTAILATIGGSLLFASQNYDIQPNHQNIQNVVSILEAPSKTAIKKYTNNLSAQRIENMTYLVRDDGWIPYYLEPIDINDIYSPAFYGQISTQYNLTFDKKVTDISALKLELENFLGFNLKEIIVSGSSGIMIKIDKKLTAQEVEYIKAHISQFQNVIWSDINSGILPEYQTQYYMDLLNNSLIPEKVKKTQQLFHPDFPDYEIFEQTEIEKLNSSYTRNAPHKWDTKFKKVKILSNGIVPYTNEKFNINNPKNFNAIYGYIPGKYYIGLEALSNGEINNIENIKIYLETISSLELISIKKSEYSGYDINFDISKISQKELYNIENKIRNNLYIKYIEKSSIILEKYNNSEILEALKKHNIDTMYDL